MAVAMIAELLLEEDEGVDDDPEDGGVDFAEDDEVGAEELDEGVDFAEDDEAEVEVEGLDGGTGADSPAAPDGRSVCSESSICITIVTDRSSWRKVSSLT